MRGGKGFTRVSVPLKVLKVSSVCPSAPTDPPTTLGVCPLRLCPCPLRLSPKKYSSDEKTRLPAERSFEIIGEALNRSLKVAPEQVEAIRNHRQIISFRNILAHCYDTVEDKIVWGIIEGSLPDLLDDLHKLLSEN